MRYTRIISILITAFILLQQITFAFDIEREQETANASSQSVTILKDGKEIYSGSLDEYENGRYANVDFDNLDILLIWNITDDSAIQIIPDKSASNSTQNIALNNSSVTADVSLKNSNAYTENAIDDNLYYEVKITNKSSEVKHFTPFFTVYTHDGALKKVYMGDKAAAGKNSSAISSVRLNTHEISDNDIIKAMVWDSDTMTPYAKSLIISDTTTDFYGNDYASATQINDLSKDIIGKIQYYRDYDYVKISLPEDANYNFFIYGDKDIKVSLYNDEQYYLYNSEYSFSRRLKGNLYLVISGEEGCNYLIHISKAEKEYDNFDIYSYDKEINEYKQNIENKCEELYDTSIEQSKELYNQYLLLLEKDAELHKNPNFMDLSKYGSVDYYKTKWREFEQLKETYKELSESCETVSTDFETNNRCTPIFVMTAPEFEATEEEIADMANDAVSLNSEGIREPEITITNKTSTSITIRAVYPITKYSKLNKLDVLDFNRPDGRSVWIHPFNNSRRDEIQTYVLNDLEPGGIYVFAMMWSTDGKHYGGDNTLMVRVQTNYDESKPENLVSVTSPKKHIKATLEEDDKACTTESRFDEWLANMDTVYETLRDFTGNTPYNGETIELLSSRADFNTNQPNNQTYWRLITGYSGNPVKISQPFYKSHMRRLNNNDSTYRDWGDTPIHELSHDFDDNRWLFDAEALSFLKTAYVLETVRKSEIYREDTGACDINDTNTLKKSKGRYSGSYYYNFLKNDWLEGYNEKFVKKHEYSPAGLAAILLDIKNKTGWTAFSKAFHHIGSLEYNRVPMNEIGKLNLFLSLIGKYSGEGRKVYSIISDRDKEIIETEFNGELEYINPDELPVITFPNGSNGRCVDISVSAGDYKQYQFIPATSGIYRIYTSPYGGTGAENDTYLELRGDSSETGEVLADNDNADSTTKFSKIEYNMEVGKPYFISVFNKNSNYRNLHTRITIVKTAEDSEICLNEKKPISVDNTEIGIYEFTPAASGEYVFEVENGSNSYIKLYGDSTFKSVKAQSDTKIIHWLKGGHTYYLQFSGYLMRRGSGTVMVKEGHTLEFVKRADSNFIYVNNPEYIAHWDIVDDESHSNYENVPPKKIFEQENITGKNTYYEPHLAWWSDPQDIKNLFPQNPATSANDNHFYFDVDFYNPTNETVSIDVSNLAYLNENTKDTYGDIQKYLNGNGVNKAFSIAPGKHKLLFKDIIGKSYKIKDLNPNKSGWDRAKAMFVLFDFIVNNGNITVSSLAAYDENNLILSDNSANVLSNVGYVLKQGEVIYEERENENDIYQKYKGIARNQSAEISANIDVLIDDYTDIAESNSDNGIPINLYEPYYSGVVHDNTKTWWMTNMNPLYDDSHGLFTALPSNIHKFKYAYENGRKWNFDLEHYDLRMLDLNGGVNDSVNMKIPESVLEQLKQKAADGGTNTSQLEPKSLGMASWGATYHYTLTVNNTTDNDRTVEYVMCNFDEMIVGNKLPSQAYYNTQYLRNVKTGDWRTVYSINIPAHQTKTFEIAALLACGKGGTNNKILVK